MTANPLKTARKKKRFTQQYMAQELGYKSKSAYCMIEKGINQPPVRIALKIAELLEEDVGVLFGAHGVHESGTSRDEQAATSA